MSSTFKVAAGNTQETANALSKMASLLLVDENVDFLINNEGVAWLIAARITDMCFLPRMPMRWFGERTAGRVTNVGTRCWTVSEPGRRGPSST